MPPKKSESPFGVREAIARIKDAPRGNPFVVAQLGQTLDGRIATESGESRWINGEAALNHLHAVRSVVDAVVVGVGTVLADDPLLNVRRVPLKSGCKPPARIVIDPRHRAPDAARCFNQEDGAASLRIVSEAKTQDPSADDIVLPTPDGEFDPVAIVAALHARGYSKLLIEGGAGTVSGFIDAGAVDRLHVLVAPMIIGSGKAGLSLRPITQLSEALRPKSSVHILADGDVLFDCDLRSA